VLGDVLVDEVLRVDPLAHQPALHVGERHDDRVDPALGNLLLQLVDAQHAAPWK
jgi:hypothetical protein